MQYLTYDEYVIIGGVLDETAYNRNIDRANGVIDNATCRRIETMTKIPREAKSLCRNLVEYFANNSITQKEISSKSQSANGLSESESYAVKTLDQQAAEIDNIICDYLLSVKNDNGVPLLYRGAAV